jgi:glycine/D-amino acid oxidase-like deaminating enzyme/nitrite reductase/ring-hydroxylating ferredoxin subunit
VLEVLPIGENQPMELQTATRSLWMATGPADSYAPLTADLSVPIVVLGAGIAGLSTAFALQSAGADVAVLDQSTIGSGVTGHTTAKLSSLQGLRYAQLSDRFGTETATAYATANERGLARIAGWAEELGIACDLRRRPNYTYAAETKDLPDVEREAEAARAAGLPAELVGDVPLPFGTAGAVRLADQAEFHPRKFLAGLAAAFVDAGGAIYEHTRATGVHDGTPCRVETANGATVTAEHVVVATHHPFPDRALFFARMHPERSYAIAARIARESPPGMFISSSPPTRSIRSHPVDGEELLLIGGEGHKVGQGGETGPRYHALEAFARAHWDSESVEYRWSAQDNMPADGLPYIGRLTPRSKATYVATGFRKWGLALGAAAAEIIAGAILGDPPAWGEPLNPNRLPPVAAAKDLATENANVGMHFFADRLTKRAPASDDLGLGEGRVVSRHSRQVAVSRDAAGVVRAVSARCPHLGCIVTFNDAEQSWDCPCHGSRFALDGAVLQGPAVDPLDERGVD